MVGVLGANHHNGTRRLAVQGGRTTVSFFPSILKANHLTVKTDSTAEGDPNTGDASLGFSISKSDLKFTLIDGRLKAFEGGTLAHKGGFALKSGTHTLNAENFSIAPSTSSNDLIDVTLTSGKESYVAFDLVNPRTLYQPKDNVMNVAYMDLVLSARAAQELGRPELAGKLIGSMSVFMNARPIDGQGEIEIPAAPAPSPHPAAGLDVSISNMGSLTAVGRVGTFPNGRNGLSMSTTSCNVGTVQIPWFAPMQVNHPAIAMNLYRIVNGRFEQVGWSWMKHGFFATNSSGCGSCQNPGTGTLLGLGCSDTYAVSNNSDRNYLGGRDEINPLTGVWTCQNSYFSNYQPDCVRRNNGSGLDAVAHRLEVSDADLQTAGAQYVYEAYYVAADDVNRYNNIASRTASFSWSGTQWNVTTTDSVEAQGPAINRWGEKRSTAQPQTDGDVIVAVQTTNLGNGMWHYEYSVYNHTLDRQVREFSVPMPNGKIVQNIGFHDIDTDSTNDWVGVYANDKMTWSTGVFGSSTADPLKYASVFNFRFDCNVPPVDGNASLGMFKPGTGSTLTASTKTPFALQPGDTMQVANGTILSGDLQSLASSDDNRLVVTRTAISSRAGVGVVVGTAAAPTTVNTLTVGVESSNNGLTGNPAQTIELWNWSTNDWELIDTRPASTTDAVALVAVTSNPARFVNSSTHEVKVRVLHLRTTLGSSAFDQSRISFDQIGFNFN